MSAATLMLAAYAGLRPKALPAPPREENAPLGPAADWEAPAAPKSLGDSALGEPAQAPAAYTNESLQKDLEAQKSRMGIKTLLPPRAERELPAAPAPAALTGWTPELLAAQDEPGRAAYSREELALLWRERNLPPPAPQADFTKEMVVAVFGQARIESAEPVSGRLLVRYQALLAPPAPEARWRVLPRSDLPVAFARVP